MLESGGWEWWSKDTLPPLPGAEEAETQMSANKNPPERGGQNLLISQLCAVKQFVRAWSCRRTVGFLQQDHGEVCTHKGPQSLISCVCVCVSVCACVQKMLIPLRLPEAVHLSVVFKCLKSVCGGLMYLLSWLCAAHSRSFTLWSLFSCWCCFNLEYFIFGSI